MLTRSIRESKMQRLKRSRWKKSPWMICRLRKDAEKRRKRTVKNHWRRSRCRKLSYRCVCTTEWSKTSS
jgi:hypothetical protein